MEPSLSSPLGEACVSLPAIQGTSGSIKSEKSTSDSEREFGWAMGALKHGVSMTKVVNYLEAQAKKRGKRQPNDYARRTAMGAYKILHHGS